MGERLDGARVIVTGASRGIGGAVTEAVAAEGGRLRACSASAGRWPSAATVPHPSARVAPFIAILAGEDPGPHVEAAQWTAA